MLRSAPAEALPWPTDPSGPAYRHRLDDPEATHRPRGQPPGLELIGRQQPCGLGVDDDPVAAGHGGQAGGHVDRWPEDVAEPKHDEPRGEADADVGHPRV